MRTTAFTLTVLLLLPLGAAWVLADEPPAPEPGADAERIQELIRRLGADDYQTRTAASEELTKIGEAARPALEEAAKKGESPETRWRAEQILRRLKGGEAQPLDGTEIEPEDDEDEPSAQSDLQRQMEAIREMMKRLHRGRSGLGGPGWDFFGARRFKAPGLVLEQKIDGAKLIAKTKDANGVEREQVYRGRDLDEILARNPDLKRHAGMDELKKQLDPFAQWRDLLGQGGTSIRIGPGGSGTTFFSSQGLTVREDGTGATVTVTEQDEEGKPVQKVYKGESLDEIKKEHPHLKERLDKLKSGITFSFGPTQFVRPGQRGFRLEPFRPTTPSRTERTARTFGIVVVPVDSVLAYHLSLGRDEGVLVKSVIPGSQAEQMGMKRNDIVLSVNGQAVTGTKMLPALLRGPVHDNGALEIELVRRGERTKVVR